MVKNLLAVTEKQEICARSQSLEHALEEGMATHSSNSCLENVMDREAWWFIVQRVTKSQTRLKRLRTHATNYVVLLKWCLKHVSQKSINNMCYFTLSSSIYSCKRDELAQNNAGHLNEVRQRTGIPGFSKNKND